MRAAKHDCGRPDGARPRSRTGSTSSKRNYKKAIAAVLDELLPEAFATVREACRRLVGTTVTVTGHDLTWDMVPYDVQLIGGIVLHQGKIAEMATGEGKTLVATLPLYLNALTGRGAHLVTVNNYLARRDRSGWATSTAGSASRWPASTTPSRRTPERRAAYLADITYGTNNEFGFDYLRDNMVFALEQRVQREHAYAIIDEVDSILIDEARTPLIISGPGRQRRGRRPYAQFNRPVSELVRQADRRGERSCWPRREKLLDGRRSARARRGIKLYQAQLGMPKNKRLHEAAQRDRASSSWCSGSSSTPSPTGSCRSGSSRCGTSRTSSTSCSTRRATRCT